jgi:hypothetical protein
VSCVRQQSARRQPVVGPPAAPWPAGWTPEAASVCCDRIPVPEALPQSVAGAARNDRADPVRGNEAVSRRSFGHSPQAMPLPA